MQEIFAQYGLWILIVLLAVVVVLFLIGGKKDSESPAPDNANELESVTIVPSVLYTPDMAAATVLTETQDDAHEASEAAAEPAQSTDDMAAPVAQPVTDADTQAPDNLLLLKGVGPKLNILLGQLGITRFAQIAAWTPADIAAIDEKLGNFKGRPQRDNWVDQAHYLANGDTAGFEAKYGKL